jgi:hypothetical protein
MDVRMPDGVVVKNVPEGVTQDDLLERYSLSKQPQRTGGTIMPTDVPQVITAQNRGSVMPTEPSTSMMDKLKALYEVPAAIGSGMVAQPVGAAYGAYKGITGPKNPQAMQQAQQAGGQLAQKLQFQPTSPASVNALESIGGALEAAKIPPYLGAIGAIPSAIQAGNVARPAAQQAVQAAKPAMQAIQEVKPTLANALRGKVTVEGAPTMAGVGAAEVPEAATRMQIAQQLRVPVDLSKGQAMRDLGQQKFEIETPKNFPELGKPLIEAQAKRNDAILQNFDAFVDATGKETYGLRETGRIVDKALVNEANKRKAEINAAYTAAKEAGETQQPLSYAPLKSYIDEQTPTVKRKLAPILSAVDEEIARNDPKRTGQISINNLEDIYQFINKNYEPGTPAGTYAKEMKSLINTITEGQGGELYQIARDKRTKFGREFENVGYVDKLLRTKPGTTDRAVGFEDVFDHAILNGTRDDVAAIGRTLKKAGPEGQQAWKELQGQTIQYMKDQVSKSVDVDSFGNPVVSPAKFKSVVTTLDQDGKLEYVFGKKGAQEIRDLLETTINVNAPLKGAANYSNTSSAIITALDKINATPLGKIPVLGTASKFVAEKGKESALKKQIEESIKYTPEDMAKALKGK